MWKSENGGGSWKNISDGYFGGSIGAVAVSEADNNVIYVGGGEKTVRGNVSYGYGLWKSEDGGDTWKRVLYANADAGAVDLILDPNNSRIIYASTWRIRRTPYSLESGGEGSGLWKSTDSGETWENISENKGLPEGLWGISAVAISPVNSDRVRALIENDKGGVYRSDDAGKTWKKLNDNRALRQRAWYYTRIYANTQDEEVVYVVNVRYHKSTDGGKTFKPHVAPHGDHHDLWIAPEETPSA